MLLFSQGSPSTRLTDEDLAAGDRPSGVETEWDGRYGGEQVWSGNPNGTLVAEASALIPGTALDVGAGEGADALWLAESGWQVTASDVSSRALARVEHEARRRGLAVRTWHVDANSIHPYGDERFDLVSLQYGSFARTPDGRGVRSLLDAVAPGGTLLVGGVEPDCDPLEWVDDPDEVAPLPTVACFEAQAWRAARRLPGLAVPHRPTGLAGVYDVTPDWVPVYDRTDLDGYYVAIGTSGNQFKNAPLVGEILRTLVDACEAGHDHDADPVSLHCRHTGHDLDVGAFSRRRDPASTTGTVLG